MSNLIGNAIVGQSGGPTSAINASLAGVIRGARDAACVEHIYGMRNGIEGLLEERIISLDELAADDSELQLLEQTPASALGTCRRKLPEVLDDILTGSGLYKKVFAILKKYNIRYFFYIGGNDSMDTVAKLAEYAEQFGHDVRFVGVPKTIDNDLIGTDHTPGFGSAAKFVAITAREIVRDCAVYTTKAVTVVEIMGRDAGWLTAASALGRLVDGVAPDCVYLPERPFYAEHLFENIKRAFETHGGVVIAVSEGIKFRSGRYVGEGDQNGYADEFGHRYLAGAGKVVEGMVRQRFGCKVRSIELNLPQRCAGHLISLTDAREASAIGYAAVGAAIEGNTGVMMTFERAQGDEYICNVGMKRVSEIANAVRCVPDEFINASGDNVTDECLKYLHPLVIGEYPVRYEKGLPIHKIL